MDKRFAFIGVAALTLLLLPSFAIAQSENSDLMDMITQIWESITGTETADETTETIEAPMAGEPLEGGIISDSEIAAQEGETATHETKESVTFEVVPVEEYNISLFTGWNLISTPYQLVNETLDSFLENIDGQWNIMEGRSKDNCAKAQYYWCINRVALPPQINKINNLQGYWINVTDVVDGDNITATGIHYYKEISVLLYKPDLPNWDGWNMIGYPRNSSVTVENLLDSSLSSNWTLLEAYENGGWLYAIEETPEPLRDTIWTLKNVTPGKGYLIKMTENDTLIIPETTRPY
ncbi:MAG: hypothetical protein L6243_06140 [Candidatus Altiarchaeales archaeon]|nr:hypothetical protein [Candidatus Altiarchaeota archaeon]MCG2783153.1 hypothetical protein [Candidatus Altiarchaeales archaeon]